MLTIPPTDVWSARSDVQSWWVSRRLTSTPPSPPTTTTTSGLLQPGRFPGPPPYVGPGRRPTRGSYGRPARHDDRGRGTTSSSVHVQRTWRFPARWADATSRAIPADDNQPPVPAPRRPPVPTTGGTTYAASTGLRPSRGYGL